MIGFYDYTIVLTLMSLVSAVIGMTRATQGYFRSAIVCLAICGLLDAFDGKVARTKKNRTNDETLYGIQLDSLVDMVSFGIFPGIICYVMGMRSIVDIVILSVYAICGVIRLAYFNVLETNRQTKKTNEEKVFHGLPITSISVILPLGFLLSFAISENVFTWILRTVMILTAMFFVLDFKMHKLKNWHLAVLIIVVGLATLSILLFSKFKLPKNTEPEEPLLEIEEIEDILEMEE